MGKRYQRYREWAAGFDKRASVVLGVVAGAFGAVVAGTVAFLGDWQAVDSTLLFWKVLPIVCLVAGPIAAFDAWGAAAFRNAKREGLIRAAIILCIFWGFAAYGLAVHS